MVPSPMVKNLSSFAPSQVGIVKACSKLRVTTWGAGGAAARPAAAMTSGTGLVGASASVVAGLAVGGANILDHIASMPTTDQRVILTPDFGSVPSTGSAILFL